MFTRQNLTRFRTAFTTAVPVTFAGELDFERIEQERRRNLLNAFCLITLLFTLPGLTTLFVLTLIYPIWEFAFTVICLAVSCLSYMICSYLNANPRYLGLASWIFTLGYQPPVLFATWLLGINVPILYPYMLMLAFVSAAMSTRVVIGVAIYTLVANTLLYFQVFPSPVTLSPEVNGVFDILLFCTAIPAIMLAITLPRRAESFRLQAIARSQLQRAEIERKIREKERDQLFVLVHNYALRDLTLLQHFINDSVVRFNPSGECGSLVAFTEINQRLEAVSTELRNINYQLRPTLIRQNFCVSLEGLGKLVTAATSSKSKLEGREPAYELILTGNRDNIESIITPHYKELLYNVISEAVFNAVKYAQASKIKVFFTFLSEQRPQFYRIELMVQDDGVGMRQVPDITELTQQTKSGLIYIVSTLRALGANNVEIITAPNAGFQIASELELKLAGQLEEKAPGKEISQYQ